MGAMVRIHRPVVFDLPADLGDRIEAFREAAGLSVRALARLVGVSPHRVREWRRGVAPDSRNLYLLLLIAGRMGLRDLLERPGDDLPAEVERQIAVALGRDNPPPGRSGQPPHGLRATHSPRSLGPPAREHGRAPAGTAHRAALSYGGGTAVR